MPYAFIHDVPANEQIYREIRTLLPNGTPPGLLSHVAILRDEGLRYVDVWSTEQDWIRFRDETLAPTVEKVLAEHGVPHDESVTTFEEVNVIDVWQGAA